MLIQIELKLLTTFNHTTANKSQVVINKAIRSNGAPRTPIHVLKSDTAQKFARQQLRQHTTTVSNEVDDDDMSLLEEIVSFDGPNPSEFIGDDNQYSMLSDNDTKDNDYDDDGSSSVQIKDEPLDSPVMNEADANDSGWTPRTQGTPDKPFKW
jgi:hypothetical protein